MFHVAKLDKKMETTKDFSKKMMFFCQIVSYLPFGTRFANHISDNGAVKCLKLTLNNNKIKIEQLWERLLEST